MSILEIELFYCMHIPQPYFKIVAFQVDSYLTFVLTFSSMGTVVVQSELHLDLLFQLGSGLCHMRNTNRFSSLSELLFVTKLLPIL